MNRQDCFTSQQSKDIKLTLDGQPAGDVNSGNFSLRPRIMKSCAKEGFHSWKKTQHPRRPNSLHPRSGTFSDAKPEPFELFVNALSLLEEKSRCLSHARPFVVYKKDSGSLAEIPFEKASEVSLLSLDEGGLPAVMKAGTSWYRLDEDEKLTNIDRLLPEKTASVLFRDSKLFALTPDKLWAVDDNGETASILSLPLLRDLWTEGVGFWLLAADPGKQRIFLYQVEEATARPRFLLALPYSENIYIADIAGSFLTISDRANEQLHLVDASADLPLLTILPGVHAFTWSQSHEELLTATDFEVIIHHFKEQRSQELLVRISTPVGDVAWHEGEQYVFYTTNGALYVAARDNRDERYVAKLAEGYEGLHVISATEKEIRFTSQQATSFIFWQLPL